MRSDSVSGMATHDPLVPSIMVVKGSDGVDRYYEGYQDTETGDFVPEGATRYEHTCEKAFKKGRPRVYKNPKQVPLRAEAEVLEELADKAKEAGMTRNALINDIIGNYLKTAS